MSDADTGTAGPAAGTATLQTSRFRVPGEGNSAAISLATVVVLFVLWYLVTNLGLIKPLFLPSPRRSGSSSSNT